MAACKMMSLSCCAVRRQTRSVRLALLLVVLTACPKERQVEKLEAPPIPPLIVVPERPPPPPPPPPGPVPPPAEIVTALREPGPIAAKVHVLDDRAGGKRFMNRRERSQRVLEPEVANELVARLLVDASYTDGVYGCASDPFGVSITRGDRELRFMTDCGHLYLGSHEVTFSEQMVTFLRTIDP